MEEITIVKLTRDDVNDLKALAEQTYTETFAPHNTKENLEAYLGKAFTTEQLTKELTEPNSEWQLALANNKRAGYIKVNFGNAQTELQDDKAMEIERIYVLQQFHGKSIGKVLLEKAVAIAREHNVDYVWLGVWEHNTKAISFYRKYGFVRFSQHSFFVGDDEQTDWLMKLSLKDW